MYRLRDSAAMIEDAVRTPAYLAALEQAVRPGSVVVEIGTGTGFFAIIAARLGARRVYAIESDTSIRLAREVAALNGCADRIEFIEALSTDVTLPEQGDVLLSDLRGVLPTLGVHIPSIVDARARLLKPGGIQIPSEDTLWMALLESPRQWPRSTSRTRIQALMASTSRPCTASSPIPGGSSALERTC